MNFLIHNKKYFIKSINFYNHFDQNKHINGRVTMGQYGTIDNLKVAHIQANYKSKIRLTNTYLIEKMLQQIIRKLCKIVSAL
jgi:hypothetical protein